MKALARNDRCAHAEGKIAEQFSINRNVLLSRGWFLFNLPSSIESEFQEQMLILAEGLGMPIATRPGGGLCDILSPTTAEVSKQNSLSKIHDVGEFPLHCDTAHWLTPCRYLMLACVSPGSAGRATVLLDTRRVPLNEQQMMLLQSTPLRVTNGRYSFFSTILSNARPFVRFDPGCMTPTTPIGAKALAVLAGHNWLDYIETINWNVGDIVVVDNWRLLHGRASADRPDPERKLIRISIR